MEKNTQTDENPFRQIYSWMNDYITSKPSTKQEMDILDFHLLKSLKEINLAKNQLEDINMEETITFSYLKSVDDLVEFKSKQNPHNLKYLAHFEYRVHNHIYHHSPCLVKFYADGLTSHKTQNKDCVGVYLEFQEVLVKYLYSVLATIQDFKSQNTQPVVQTTEKCAVQGKIILPTFFDRKQIQLYFRLVVNSNDAFLEILHSYYLRQKYNVQFQSEQSRSYFTTISQIVPEVKLKRHDRPKAIRKQFDPLNQSNFYVSQSERKSLSKKLKKQRKKQNISNKIQANDEEQKQQIEEKQQFEPKEQKQYKQKKYFYESDEQEHKLFNIAKRPSNCELNIKFKSIKKLKPQSNKKLKKPIEDLILDNILALNNEDHRIPIQLSPEFLKALRKKKL